MAEENNAGKKIEPKNFSSNEPLNNREAESKDIPAAQNILSQQVPVKNNKQEHTTNERNRQEQKVTGNLSHHKKHLSKKWNDYMFDFLLLFLAITAGFFVDNKREYYVEHQKANQFSKQLLLDLRLDSILFENRNRSIESMQQGFDSLLFMLTQKATATDQQILATLLPLAYVFDIPATTTTYNQMKTSGSLRYIEKTELTAHLQDYYDVLLPRSINIAKASLDFYSENILPYSIKHIRIQDYDPFNDTLLNKKPVIMNRTKETDQELANIMGNYRSLLKIQVVTMNNPALKRIKETMVILKDEYALE